MCELAHFLSNTANALGFDDTDGKSPQPCYIFRAVPSAYAAAVFVVVPIDDVMAAVFDAPMASIGCKYTFWVSLIGCSACDAICYFAGMFAAFLVRCLTLNKERLSDVRKVEIVVELICDPYFTGFNPSVIRRIALNKVGIFPIFKIERDVFKEPGLIILDSEVVIGATIPNQILGNFSLGQKRIC